MVLLLRLTEVAYQITELPVVRNDERQQTVDQQAEGHLLRAMTWNECSRYEYARLVGVMQ